MYLRRRSVSRQIRRCGRHDHADGRREGSAPLELHRLPVAMRARRGGVLACCWRRRQRWAWLPPPPERIPVESLQRRGADPPCARGTGGAIAEGEVQASIARSSRNRGPIIRSPALRPANRTAWRCVAASAASPIARAPIFARTRWAPASTSCMRCGGPNASFRSATLRRPYRRKNLSVHLTSGDRWRCGSAFLTSSMSRPRAIVKPLVGRDIVDVHDLMSSGSPSWSGWARR